MKRSAIPVQYISAVLILYRPFASIGYALRRLGNEANVCAHCTAEKKYSLRSTVNWPNRRVTPGDSQAQQKELVKERSLALRRQTFTTQQHSFHYNFSDKKVFVNSDRLAFRIRFYFFLEVHTFE